MKLLLITFALPGSGKTTFSKQLATTENFVRISSDDMRSAIHDNPSEVGDPFLRYTVVFSALRYTLERVLESGADIIYDANVNQAKFRNELYKLALKHGYSPVLINIEVNEATARTRVAEREDGLSETQKAGLIDKHIANTEPASSDEAVIKVSGDKPFSEQLVQLKAELKKLGN